MTNKLLVLVDGSSYLYRAFHALPPLMNSKGKPTGAVYGVASMLKKLITQFQPDYIAVVFDAKGKTFRDELFADYKAHRPSMPNELVQQIEPLHDLIRALHLPMLVIDGVEADDVIGTLAKQGESHGLSVVISTGDKDLAQLVNSHITLINTMSNTSYDRAGVIEKFGIPPELIVDYLTLVGDTSDNIPGVPGVGPKTAVKWLTEFGSLKNIVAQAGSIKGKVGENLRAQLGQLPLLQELVTIRCDVPLPYKVGDLIAGTPDKQKLLALAQDLEFKSWIAEYSKNEIEVIEQVNKKYHAILTHQGLDEWIKKLAAAPLVAFDTETTSLNYINAELVGLSFSIKAGEAIYIPVGHNYLDAPKQLDRHEVLAKLKPLLENTQIKKVGHHIKYDKEVVANYGINLQGIAYDTMLESYVLDSIASRHDLDTLTLKYLNHKNISYEEVAGKGAKQICFSEVAIDVVTQYAAEDADITLQLHEKFWPAIEKEPKLKKIFEEIEIPLLTVLTGMERHGVLIDKTLLAEQSKVLFARAKELEKSAFELSGQPFNLNSPKQLQEILYEKMGLPVVKKTPTGQPSTAEPILQELAHSYDLPRIILEYRSITKLKSTYTDRLPEQVNVKTGRVHTSYHQAVAGTGRLSSSDPNLQNIPIRTEAGRKIRQAFIAPEGYQILAADYSQIELRIMAHLSRDKGLIDAFSANLDIHRATASQVFGVSLHDVTDDQRRKAKAINFGLMYGMSAFGLAKQLGVERAAAQAYIDSYFCQYPGVLDYMERTRKQAHEMGFVETLLGRRLYLPDINARNIQLQKGAERAAINAPMQGTAADIIKLAMISVERYLHDSDIDASMVMQVHDELVFEVASSDVEELKEKVNLLMSHALELVVPLVVDIGVGNNWDEAH